MAVFGKKDVAPGDDELVHRAQNVLRNDGENTPIFLFLAMTYIQLGCWETGTLIYFPLFVLSRIIHAIAYLGSIQPLRNRVYLLGVLVMFILCGHILWVVFTVPAH